MTDRLGISEANLTRGKVGFGLAEWVWSLLDVGREGGGVGLGGDCSGGEVDVRSIAINAIFLRGGCWSQYEVQMLCHRSVISSSIMLLTGQAALCCRWCFVPAMI